MHPTAAEILALIAEGEGKQLEFKSGLPRDERAARTLAAFANTRGGTLLVGIGDRGEVLGAPHPRETARKLRAIASANVEPPVSIDVALVDVDGRPIVCCWVPLSASRP